MSDDTTIAQLKNSPEGLVGKIIASGINRYVVVGISDTGILVMALAGTFNDEYRDVVYHIGDNAVYVLVDNAWREYWKNYLSERWNYIASIYPAING